VTVRGEDSIDVASQQTICGMERGNGTGRVPEWNGLQKQSRSDVDRKDDSDPLRHILAIRVISLHVAAETSRE